MAEDIDEVVISNDQFTISINKGAAPQYPGVISLSIAHLVWGSRLEVMLTAEGRAALAQKLLDPEEQSGDGLDPCPECGAVLKEKASGVKCTKCEYWFCY